MENNNRRKLGTYQICLIALAIVMNVIGGQIALALRLPIYLDSIGTIMIGAMIRPPNRPGIKPHHGPSMAPIMMVPMLSK